MAFQTILFSSEEGIATITLNRPEFSNAMDQQMANELVEAIRTVSQDEETRVLVLKGAGRAFCTGADAQFGKVRTGQVTVEEMKIWPETDRELRRGNIPPKPQRYIFLGLQRLDKPTIAVVNGVASGLGYDLALACDIRIGSPQTMFVIGYTTLGVPPDSGGAWLMPRVIGLSKALEYLFTGDFCPADEAHRIGLLNRVVLAEHLEEEAMGLARRIATMPAIALGLSKLAVYKGLRMNLGTALAFAAACRAEAAP